MPRIVAVASALLLLSATGPAGRAGDAPRAGDERTFRPTVLVRQGDAAGSGTVIASVPGETLVLTAAHVVGDAGEAVVEVHRYNLGLEATRAPDGWPVRLAARVAAADPAGDVAVLRIVGKAAMPHVARLAPVGGVARGTAVTSVGIDGASKLSSWDARVLETAWFIMDPVGVDDERPGSAPAPGPGHRTRAPSSPLRDLRRTRAAADDDVSGPSRPFLLTSRTPRLGRSGGGLFDANGALVGVCVGFLEDRPGHGPGVFATAETVRRLLRQHDLEPALERPATPRASAESGPATARSVAKPAGPHHNTDGAGEAATAPRRDDRARTGGPAPRRP